MKQIPLTQGQFALVDDEDFEELNQYKWHSSLNYAMRKIIDKGAKKTILMHSFIMKTPKGMCTDHIDGNRLNNQKNNLRICTKSENAMNRGKTRTNKSGYKGIYWNTNKKRWHAQIVVMGKNKYLGLFDDKMEAYNKYCEYCVKLHGEFYHL